MGVNWGTQTLLISGRGGLSLMLGSWCSWSARLGMLVQSLGILGERSIPGQEVKDIWDTPGSFKPLCSTTCQKASPAQPLKENYDHKSVWQHFFVSSQMSPHLSKETVSYKLQSGLWIYVGCSSSSQENKFAPYVWPRVSLPIWKHLVEPCSHVLQEITRHLKSLNGRAQHKEANLWIAQDERPGQRISWRHGQRPNPDSHN